jgi:hypothetical protein
MLSEEAERARIDPALGVAVVNKESNFSNVFGWDWGEEFEEEVPFAHLRVTRERAVEMLEHLHAGGRANGFGLSQITWPATVYTAEEYGGCHLPRYQCRAGFEVLAWWINNYGYMRGLSGYNSGVPKVNRYGRDLAALHEDWKRRLANG